MQSANLQTINHLSSPFQGSLWLIAQPRPLAWANLVQAFGLEEQYKPCKHYGLKAHLCNLCLVLGRCDGLLHGAQICADILISL